MTLKYFLAKIPLVTKFLMLGVKMTKEENQYYLVKRRGIYTVIPIEWREVSFDSNILVKMNTFTTLECFLWVTSDEEEWYQGNHIAISYPLEVYLAFVWVMQRTPLLLLSLISCVCKDDDDEGRNQKWINDDRHGSLLSMNKWWTGSHSWFFDFSKLS